MNTSKVFNTPEGKFAIFQYYDVLLSHMAVPYEKKRVKTRFGDTFVLAAGQEDAPRLVLLHGSSMNSAMWIKDMEKYAQRFRVYALDLPGEPGKSVETQLPFDTDDYPNWLLDAMNALKVEKAVLMGISLGAWLCLKFSMYHPERVNKLVLLCPAGVGQQNHAFKDIAMSLLPQGEAGVHALFMKINGDNPIPEIMLNYQKLIAMNFNTRMEPIPLFTDAELRGLAVSSIMFFGERDIMLNAAEAVERFKRLVPNATTALLSEKGHSLTGLADTILECI